MIREIVSAIRNLPRHLKNAFLNVLRNGVMSISSIMAVALTLILTSMILIVAITVNDITKNIEDNIQIHVKLDKFIRQDSVNTLMDSINTLENVTRVTYSSKEEELDKFIESYGADGYLWESYRADNPLSPALLVDVSEGQYLEGIAAEIEIMPDVITVNYGGDSTVNLVATFITIRNGGSFFVGGLILLAVFLISNTIRLTITARSYEIGIMRLVGASNWYIRIPFMLEGVLIGVFGSLIPIILTVYCYMMLYNVTGGAIVTAIFALRSFDPFIFQISGLLAGIGAGVGLIGSFISVNKHLKL